MTREINVAIIGQRFMGRAHANAYRQVRAFFAPPVVPRLQLACGRDDVSLRDFARRFGWEEHTTDWHDAVTRDDIDLIDICASNDLHAEIAIAAAQAGKAVFCEKPLGRDLAEAKRMHAAVVAAGVPHMICFNYRFFPAIQLAKKLIADGAVGEIRQFHAFYLQDWLADPTAPFTWRVDKARAGSGALGDTAVYITDLARFLVGEITEVVGDLSTFVHDRPLPDGSGTGMVTVDDAAAFLARFQNGARGVFESTRMATGRKNFMHIEVNGTRGSVYWNVADPNVLWFYSRDDPTEIRGFRRILATEPEHMYAKAWWPPGHTLGYEHAFVHAVYVLLTAIADGRVPEPSFSDGVKAQAVLDAVTRSVETRSWVTVED